MNMENILHPLIHYLYDRDKIALLLTCKRFSALMPKISYTDHHNYHVVAHLTFICNFKNIYLITGNVDFTEHMVRHVTHLIFSHDLTNLLIDYPVI